MTADEVRKRLREGSTLEITTGGGAFEVWAEPFASPPRVYYEGEPFDLDDLDTVVHRILEQLREEGVRSRWVDKD